MKRRMSLILAVLSIILAFVGSMTGVSYAYANEYEMHGSAIGNQLNEADITSIRFSYNRMEGFVSPYPVSGSNICTGFFVDYLNEVASNCGMKVDYVEPFNGSIYDALMKDEADLILVCYDERYDFSEMALSAHSIINSYIVLYTRYDSDVCFKEYEAFDGMRIGMLGEFSGEDVFAEYAADNGFSFTSISYNSLDELYLALEGGQIDAFAVNSLYNVDGNVKNVDIIGGREMRLAAKAKDKAIIERIDASIDFLSKNSPTYVSDLFQNHYFSNQYLFPALSRTQKDFVDGLEPLKVGYLESVYPLECTENGQFSGIVRRVFDFIEQTGKIHFEYIPYDSTNSCVEALKKGEIDLIGMSILDSGFTDTKGMISTRAYLSVPIYQVTLKKHKGEFGDLSIGLTNIYSNNSNHADISDYVSEILYFDTIKDCLNAVRNNKVDVAYINEYSWASYSTDKEFNDLVAVPSSTPNSNLTIAALDNEKNREIIQVLNYVIGNITQRGMHFIISEELLTARDEGSIFYRFMVEYLYEILFAIFLFVFAGLGLLLLNKRRKEETLERIAYLDETIGHSNFNKFVLDAREKLQYENVKYALGYINIDNFKYINDFYGREQGDKVLQNMSQIINDFTVPNGIYARQSADKFVFLVDYMDYESLKYNIQTAITDIDINVSGFSETAKIKSNCGVFIVEDYSMNILDMIDKAAIAEKYAKNSLQNSVVRYDNAIDETIIKNQEMTAMMEKALLNEEFDVYLQPKMDIKNGVPVGCEALVRWISPTKGMIRPDEFIPLFEKNGFVTELDFYVLDKVCKFLRRRMDAGLPVVPISVNQSRLHVSNVMYLSMLQNTLYENGIPMNLIVFEITESAFIESQSDMIALINRMKKLGFTFSMDDFGSGYSSFHLLKDMPIDELKIDKEFLDSVKESQRSHYIIKNIVKMAHGLNIKVVCEGVETEEQVEFLRSVSCDIAQGYYYAKPMPMKQFEEFLEKF